ncbi:thioredoxin family protein [Tundrisphaera sp. TA3]|uniref:thioredoxin family protein n=1 Tax=Tundrisphaera sp. TA3 TaxID=3435775 RepID=UPI003EC06172
MALTPSTMLPLGTKAPAFALPDPSGQIFELDQIARPGQILTVWFLCNHCPYVKHVRHALADLGRAYQAKGVAVVGINSNDADAYPSDNPEAMAREAAEVGYTFPYLFDATQKVAHAYHAACTPDFYVFDADRSLVYRGQMDASRPGNPIPVSGVDLRLALDAAIDGRPPLEIQRPSMGCNIKWRPGNEPDYYGKA